MRFLVCFASIIMISACVTVKMVGFDKESNTVTFQGEQWDSKEDFQKEADQYCGKKATLIKMNQITEGSQTTINNSNNGTTNAQTSSIKKYQYIFKCN
ncbi:hypothetical protein [Silvanigrella aquatica]|uniref:DUF4156 domain-containing protein n=1 Tax=Silvanigrella aquatica TaxID=1915309 RepID=A0A1L4D2C2_9BACT|nr:hypothetical protein [Silvanigrella aquatica]APJ04344.1 hypothetical protein AXG55_10675 [Silvanigrella aquatica]